MSEMIERVARALYVSVSTNEDPGRDWDELAAMEQHAVTTGHYRRLAEAAIAAMREPTEAMIDEADEDELWNAQSPTRTWQTMIGAALKPSASPEPPAASTDADFSSWVRQQHCGELCTFGPPQDRTPTWIVKFEDAERGDSIFDDEAEAIDFYLQASNSWNCTLLTTVRISDASPVSPASSPEPRPSQTPP